MSDQVSQEYNQKAQVWANWCHIEVTFHCHLWEAFTYLPWSALKVSPSSATMQKRTTQERDTKSKSSCFNPKCCIFLKRKFQIMNDKTSTI